MGIELKGVTKIYPARSGVGSGEVRALDGVRLSVPQGEWLAVMGPSGSGKSTLINLIGCLDQPTAGEIWVDGVNLATMKAAEAPRFRAEKIGFIFQQFHLIPYLTALENVMLAQYFHSMTDKEEVLEALRRVGVEERAGFLPAQLSGGEQQRVCVARALINDPAIILADEPTGNLDARNEELVLRLLRELRRQGRTIVMVTHDPVVARLADRRVELHHGRIAAQEIFSMPDEEQFDEVLEEMWVLEENGARAELGRMQVGGALPLALAVEKMEEIGLITRRAEAADAGNSKPVLNRCHEQLWEGRGEMENGDWVVEFTEIGRQRAADVIRRHRLAERLFTQALHLEDEAQVEQQACKFEHILSPEVTDSICSFLDHPRTCPHGSPIPAGACCRRAKAQTT